MTLGDPLANPEALAAFRQHVKQVRDSLPAAWELSRKYVSAVPLHDILKTLTTKIYQAPLESVIRESLLHCLNTPNLGKVTDLNTGQLKILTGLPASKALRALCVLFGVGHDQTPSPESNMPLTQIEEILSSSTNPYDLLLQAPAPSLLDLGAGDLSFEQELVERYLPQLQDQPGPLTLHAIDRLQPGSRLGGVYHANQERQKTLKAYLSKDLDFRFWGGVNMMGVESLKGRRPRYSMVTCHAPASPTFAFEPSRLSPATINGALRERKGEFRVRRLDGEPTLEVKHKGQILSFPPWKFEICGPLALLQLMARLGQVCVLTAIDDEVFWELLSQLVADETYRPRDILFSPHNLPEIFGSLYQNLTSLPLGHSIQLSDLMTPRPNMPRQANSKLSPPSPSFRFRWIEIRRGAMLEGIPSSFTARQFTHMREEALPWWLILVPETFEPEKREVSCEDAVSFR